MSSSAHSTAHRLSKQKQHKQTTKETMLPKAVRDELRMCVALRGYSSIRSGFGKKLETQYKLMETFFHGKLSQPSQIQMLVDGQLAYAALYDSKTAPVASKKQKTEKKKDSPVQYYLKHSLSRVANQQFFQHLDINVGNLERKLRTGKAILHGRQLETMAKKGLKHYRKALCFTKDKWDFKTNEPKMSGTTVDDVINYVRLKMYKNLVLKNDGEDMDDDDKVDEVVAASNEEATKNDSMTRKNHINNDIDAENLCEDNNNDLNGDNNESVCNNEDGNDLSNDNSAENENKKNTRNGTNLNDENGNDSNSNNNSDLESGGSDEHGDKDDDYVPEDYIFPSFMAYVLWGPFAIESDKLSLFCTDDAPKSTVMSRAAKRKAVLQKKKEERENDRSAIHGFSTDQRINIQALNISQKRLEHQKNQSFLVSLSIQESAMSRQIEAAEKRAMIRCPTYDANNVHWKLADDLALEHQVLVKSIGEKTEKMFNNNNNSLKDNDVEDTVGSFLNQPSPPPKKKRKASKELEEVLVSDESDDEDFVDGLLKDPTIIGEKEDVHSLKSIEIPKVSDTSNLDSTVELQKNKMNVATSKSNVSTMAKHTSTRNKRKK